MLPWPNYIWSKSEQLLVIRKETLESMSREGEDKRKWWRHRIKKKSKKECVWVTENIRTLALVLLVRIIKRCTDWDFLTFTMVPILKTDSRQGVTSYCKCSSPHSSSLCQDNWVLPLFLSRFIIPKPPFAFFWSVPNLTAWPPWRNQAVFGVFFIAEAC